MYGGDKNHNDNNDKKKQPATNKKLQNWTKRFLSRPKTPKLNFKRLILNDNWFKSAQYNKYLAEFIVFGICFLNIIQNSV